MVPSHTALVPRMLPAGISNCSLPLQTITIVSRKMIWSPSTLTALHGNGASGESDHLLPCDQACAQMQNDSTALANKIEKICLAMD